MERSVPSWLERTELLIGADAVLQCMNANILLVGLGGVGSYAGEFLVRAGIGSITIIDGDVVDPTNKNRQLQALDSTKALSKSGLLEIRFRDINPEIRVTAYNRFLEPDDMAHLLKEERFDFVLDCIDSISPKISLIKQARQARLKVISSMGAGGKTDPSRLKIADISATRECKFAKTVRKRLKYEGIRKGVTAVYSEEIQPKSALHLTDGSNYKKSYYGTISYMPALFGLMIASEVIRRLAGLK
jgi:tRNA threonylcarbamoyladenosine dehydratase